MDVSPANANPVAPLNEVLARASIFQGVDADAVAALSAQLQPVSYPRGHRVFREGEPGDKLYIIGSGTVKIGRAAPDGRESLLALLGPADIFGELAIFDPGPRTSTVTTLAPLEGVSMDREALHEWITGRPEIAEQLLRVLARRLRRTNNALCDLIFTDVPGRVAKQLLDLANRFGSHDDGAMRIDLALTQNELAQLVGSSRETINKALSDFAARGWIRQQGRATWITDPAKLARRARM